MFPRVLVTRSGGRSTRAPPRCGSWLRLAADYPPTMRPDPEHPAVAAARSTIEPGRPMEVRAFATREPAPAAAVLLSDDRNCRAVIVEKRSGVWTPPTMLSESGWHPHNRPEKTVAPWALGQGATSQSGLPRADGSPPVDAWTTFTGLAAPDALSVLVRSELDEHEVPVGPDGVVLALLRASWHGRLEIVVRTADGDVVRTTPS